MAFKLAEIVPWGRTFEEYVAMFSLQPADLEKSILGCGDGPASFNVIATQRGHSVVSADPLYALTGSVIRDRIEETIPEVIAQIRQNKDEFLWEYFDSIDQLVATRLRTMETFLGDYADGLNAGRYVDASLPALPFSDNRFELALCSHFLFLYSAQKDRDFHLEAVLEMCRVAREVRIFPLLELGSVQSRHVDSVLSELPDRGLSAQIVAVDYEFQKGGNEMLQIRPA